MKLVEVKSLAIPEVKVLRFARFRDHRGYFTETYRRSDFQNHPALDCFSGVDFVQVNESFSRRGVVRGLHFQWSPYVGKLVRTVHGRMIDLVLDIRHGSPTCGKIGLRHPRLARSRRGRVDLGAARLCPRQLLPTRDADRILLQRSLQPNHRGGNLSAGRRHRLVAVRARDARAQAAFSCSSRPEASESSWGPGRCSPTKIAPASPSLTGWLIPARRSFPTARIP